jgi:cell division protein FtsI (penicillin-binding protein 3)
LTTIAARPISRRRESDQRHTLIALAHVRLMMLMLLFGAAILAIIIRLALLGLLAATPVSREDRLARAMARGDIIDRNGDPLARTIEAWMIGVHPKQILGDRADIARQLATLMPEHDESWYYSQLTRDVNFVYLSRHAPPSLVNRVHAIGEPALVFEKSAERLYPQSDLAAHVLGYLGPSADDPAIVEGQAGIERAFQDRLTDPVLHSTPLELSIDNRVEAAMESELGQAMITFQARGAAGVVLDVHTGEVVSMVSLPVFNPNRLQGTDPQALRNNVTQSVYELGSTFKPITMAAALDDGVITDLGKKFDATAPLHVGGFTIHDERGDPKRWLTVPEILIYSSNVGTARVADLMGADRMQKIFRGMGFDTKPDIELREKARPLWPSFWARTTVMTTGFGHGIAVTPLQLANAYATLVNGGIWRPTTLLKIAPGKAPQGRRVISEQTSYKIRQMLRLIVLKGTGRKGDAPGYRVGGKTGTGEIASGGGYDRSRNIATFAAAFPMDAPRYVVVAMLDSPQATKDTYGWKTAAWNAAPVVGRVIARTGPMLGVMPNESRDVDVSGLIPLLAESTDKLVDTR